MANPSSSARRGSSSRRSRSLFESEQLNDRRVVVYIRASTEDQKLTLEGQAHAAHTWAEANGLAVAEVFIEPGISGSKPFLERKQAKAALAAMHGQGISTMVVMTLDRAFRNVADMMQTLEHILGKGLNFRMVQPDLDLRGHFGRLVAQLLGAIAEFELGCRSERQGRAFEALRRERLARSNNAPYGWDLGEEVKEAVSHAGRPRRRLLANPEEQAVLRDILKKYEERFTLQAIADELNGSGILTKRAGQTQIRKGKPVTISGRWSPATVKSVIEHAELDDDSPLNVGTTIK